MMTMMMMAPKGKSNPAVAIIGLVIHIARLVIVINIGPAIAMIAPVLMPVIVMPMVFVRPRCRREKKASHGEGCDKKKLRYIHIGL
jgi:hypothetical protein